MTRKHIVNLNVNMTKLNILILTSVGVQALMTFLIKYILLQRKQSKSLAVVNFFNNLLMSEVSPGKNKYVNFIYSGAFLTSIGLFLDAVSLLLLSLPVTVIAALSNGLPLTVTVAAEKTLSEVKGIYFVSSSYTSLKLCYRR